MTTTNIYYLKCPIDGTIKWVGKSDHIRERFLRHIGEAKHNTHNQKKNEWLNHLLKLGLQPEIIIAEKVLKEVWEEAEKRHIKILRNAGCPLFNIADGGLGVSGIEGHWKGKKRAPVSQATRDKLSKNSGRFWLGKKHSEATKQKIREKRKLQVYSEETREKQRKASTGNKYALGTKQSQETIEKRAQKLRGQKRSEEYKQSRMGHPVSDETRAKIGQVHRGKVNSEEVRNKISESLKKYFSKTKNG